MSAEENGRSALAALARLHGVQTSYRDAQGRRQAASADSLRAALEALDAEVGDPAHALARRRLVLLERLAPPASVAWHGLPAFVEVRHEEGGEPAPLDCTLDLEDGGTRRWKVDAAGAPVAVQDQAEGRRFVARRLPLPEDLPLGYHRLRVRRRRRSSSTLIIAAPRRTHHASDREWGVFLPLYAVRTARDWGAGDLGDLRALLEWARGLGATMVGTLPLLAAFLDEPFDPSPYSPASRLFWNDLYVDVEAAPELAASPDARALIGSRGFQRTLRALREGDLVDYRAAMALKRRVVELLAREVFARPSARRDALERFAAGHPALGDYAAFRAATEERRAPWTSWPAPERDGLLAEVPEERRRYHLYVQWLAHAQLEALARTAPGDGGGLYLDLPLGVHSASYDTWRERSAFALGATGGAPPDVVFTSGQDWGFPPLHPERIRDDAYRYPIACLRHLLRHSRVLRVDHVMGLHRLWWVPRGMDVRDGVYVRYPAEELYAILALESHRANAVVVGEDLGIVPSSVRRAMSRHGVHRSFVLEYELFGPRLEGPPERALATLQTHDMPPFAAFWEGLDIPERVALGMLPGSAAVRERRSRARMRRTLVSRVRSEGLLSRRRQSEPRAVLEAATAWLGASRARVVLTNLEDLWGETRSQNVPGTGGDAHPNWRRRAPDTLEALRERPEVTGPLRKLDEIRRTGRR